MNPNEIWQVDVNGQIYEASLLELTEWIAEGSLLPQDKVRRGNLRWLDAIKVPALYGFFNAKELGLAPPPLLVQTTVAAPSFETSNVEPQHSVQAQTGNFAASQSFSQNQSNNFNASPETSFVTPPGAFNQPYQTQAQNFRADFTQPVNEPLNEPFQPQFQQPQANVCVIHPGNEPAYHCEGCGNLFCKACPSSYGGTVKVCSMCGAMCKPLAVAQQNFQKAIQYQQDLSQGFGFEDFGKALAYPFKFKFSLFAGAILFMFFSLGQSASSFGGMFMMSASIMCLMMSNMLTFGILANTVENMSQGILERNFMPTFDDFNLWDDVVHPFFLSVAAYISSFGPLVLIIVFAVWYAWSTIAPVKQDWVAESSKQIQQNREARDEGRIMKDGTVLPRYEEMTAQEQEAMEDGRIQDLQKMIQENRKNELESVVGKSPETKQAEMREMISHLAAMAIPMLLLGFVALLWGLFYFPAACAVAGYTRSFGATINPLVGLDTIKRMGFDYAKILAMVLILSIMGGIISLIFNKIFSAFDLPGIGNLPATAVGSFFNFYFAIVFALILGYALYKNSVKLNLYRG